VRQKALHWEYNGILNTVQARTRYQGHFSQLLAKQFMNGMPVVRLGNGDL
jgi:hypothetical protein